MTIISSTEKKNIYTHKSVTRCLSLIIEYLARVLIMWMGRFHLRELVLMNIASSKGGYMAKSIKVKDR